MKPALLVLLLSSGLHAQPIDVKPDVYYRMFSHAHPILKRIQPGQHVFTRTLDSGGQDEKSEHRHPEPGNPLNGPFFIEGAQRGDAIEVTFHRMRLNRNWGYSAYRLGLFSQTPESIEGLYPNKYKPDIIRKGSSSIIPWDIDLERNTVRLREPNSAKTKLEFPVRPMLGCVGVAPAGDFAPTSTPAGSYGGNLDYNRIGEGATVILPVSHEGAYLFMGDGHALQADGEPTGTGVETSMDVEFSVRVVKKAAVSGPRVVTADSIISVGAQPEFVSSLDRALQMATTDMVRWLTTEYGLEPWAAHQLIGAQGKYEVVTVAGSMALVIAKRWLPAKYPDIASIAPDLQIPPVVNSAPAAGKRVSQALPQYSGTRVHHLLYLPTDWKPGRNYPVIVEYAGNGNFKNDYGDVSEGTVEGSRLGYGISGGREFIWLCLPYVNSAEKRNQEIWWGDVDATVQYAKDAVAMVIDRFGGDPQRIVLAGFSRGAIACNFIGLHDDQIAKLWRAFIPYSHYDGVRTWPYPDSDSASALARLKRLNGRPQFIIHENSVQATNQYLTEVGIQGRFTFRTLEFRNHNDAWTLRDIPERREVRQWLKEALR